MSEIKFVELSCIRCGGQLKTVNDNTYQCISCGKTFEKQVVTDVADQLRAVLNEQKQEAVANLRRQLWAEMHEQYINSEKITDLARDIKKYLPEDYFANFCEIANSGNDRQISQFLNNTPQSAMADYADIVLDFMLKSVTASNLNSISLFIERAFKGDTENYDKYITRYEEEAQKVNSGIYELIITRDVFLAYSSKDMNKVLELCDYLERNKISCFLALRNLRHGRGAVDNYDEALKTAIDNCKTVVFVSSTNSRDMTCDALIKELPYIKKKDFENAPAECKRNYYKIPSEYLMPRVQYLIEDYLNDGNVAEGIVDEFFHDLEWCRSKEEVARRVSAYLTETHETAAQRAERESRKFQQQLEEERRKAEEERRKARELELKIAEAEKARLEAERKAAEQRRTVQGESARAERENREFQQRLEEERRKAKELELKIAEAEAARIEAERRAAEQRQNTSTDNTAAEDPNAKYCKKCRAANRKTAKFCSSCGSGEFFASFDEYLASKIKFCASCGAQNNAEDKFCAECGSKEFVPTKKAYEELVVKRAEEERKRKIREEQERKRKEEAERKRKVREEQERIRREEEERQRVIREEEERKRKEKAEAEKRLKELQTLGDYNDIGYGYVTFGAYPQTLKADNVKIGEKYDKERGYYLGSDNCLYEKYKGKYYKVEPIKWKVVSRGSEWFLVSDIILDVCKFDASRNNYALSEIKSWLNREFYNKAFKKEQQNKIVITNVDNSVSSTGDKKNICVCSNTKEKVFLLSHKEAEQYLDKIAREKNGTDYAKARKLFVYGNRTERWWLRSPSCDDNRYVQYGNEYGNFSLECVDRNDLGVVPALKIKP